MATHPRSLAGFTIVELLIAIVVIGILALLALNTYSGMQTRAIRSSLQDDLSQATRKLATEKEMNSNESYPAGNGGNAPAAVSVGGGVTSQYSSSGVGTDATYCLTETKNSISYYVSAASTKPVEGACTGHTAGSSSPQNFTLTYTFDNGALNGQSSNSAINAGTITSSGNITNMATATGVLYLTQPILRIYAPMGATSLSAALSGGSYINIPITTTKQWSIGSITANVARGSILAPGGAKIASPSTAGNWLGGGGDILLLSPLLQGMSFGGESGLNGNKTLKMYIYAPDSLTPFEMDNLVISGTLQ